MGGRIIPIHTSDRQLYKICRRKWLWGSHLNRSLEPINQAAPLWFGSAFHYALKDFHGFGTDMWESFQEYLHLSRTHYPRSLPSELPELVELGKGMIEHYGNWLIRRDPLETYVLNGVPQVEVAFEITLPVDPILLAHLGAEKVVYRGTFDRISYDRQLEALFIVEYKTAARMEQAHLMMDPQVSAYMWAASCIYDLPVAGVIYQQHAKRTPKPARILMNGSVSTAKNQATTHKLYRAALCEVYGSPQQSSNEHIEVLNALGAKESPDRDDYIVRTRVARNAHQIALEGHRLMIEVHEMLNPNTPMYTHSGQHCGWCSFISACTSLEDGGDWEHELNDPDTFKVRTRASSEWEIISHDGLGGVLHNANARIQHDRAGSTYYNPSALQYTTGADPSVFDASDKLTHAGDSAALDSVFTSTSTSTDTNPFLLE